MKSRWFVTGDCHGDLSKIWRFIKRFDLGSESRIIVCGDMGIYWDKSQKDANYMIKQYEENCNGVQLFWIDGNHENFDIIDTFEKPYHKCSPHITYISRGTNIFTKINDKIANLLFLGGADSIDKAWRTEGIGWWPQEQIREEDIEGLAGKYTFVFTHCCPYSIFNSHRGFLCQHGGEFRDVNHTSEEMLDRLKDEITFKHWFFGHYHINMKLNDQFTCLLDDFIELGEGTYKNE